MRMVMAMTMTMKVRDTSSGADSDERKHLHEDQEGDAIMVNGGFLSALSSLMNGFNWLRHNTAI